MPLPDGRALISLDAAINLYEFELKLRDAIEEEDDTKTRKRSVLVSIAEILRRARRTKGIVLLQRSIIVLQSTRHRHLKGAS